jgi:hypothetical protein
MPECSVHNSVAGFVAGKLVYPERAIGCGLGRVFRAAVPEAAVHKNSEFELGKNEIRFAEDFRMSPPAGNSVPSK